MYVLELKSEKIEAVRNWLAGFIGVSMPAWDNFIDTMHDIGILAQSLGFIFGAVIIIVQFYRTLNKEK